MESSANCSICLYQNKKSDPVIWCPICSELLCSSCEQQHRVMRLSRDHATIPYKDYCMLPSFILKLDLNCPEHNEKYQNFCRSHDVPCCLKCLSNSHKKCDDTPIIDDMTRNVKSSAGFDDVWVELQRTHETYKNAIDTGENNIREIEAKQTEFAERVTEKTNDIIDQLRTIKNQTLSALDLVVTEKVDKIKTTNKTLDSKVTRLKAIIDQKMSIMTQASDYQVFIGIKHIENEIRESKETLQKMVQDGGLSTLEVTLEEHDTIEDAISSVKSLGEVQMKEGKATFLHSMDQPNRAQMMVESEFPPKLKLIQQFELEKSNYFGCCTSPSGVMAFADSNNGEIKITHKDGSIKEIVNFSNKGVSDITIIDNDHIAASNPQSKTVCIIGVDSGKIIKTLKTKSAVNGIAHHDGYIYLCVTDKGIRKINIATGKLEKVYDDKSVECFSRIDTDGKRLCYTCYHKNIVTVLDSKYKKIFEYKYDAILCGPRGLSLDNNQNMFVCNYAKRNLLLISQDGEKVDTLVTKVDGLEDPSGVHYSEETKTMLVVCTNGHVRIYSAH